VTLERVAPLLESVLRVSNCTIINLNKIFISINSSKIRNKLKKKKLGEVESEMNNTGILL